MIIPPKPKKIACDNPVCHYAEVIQSGTTELSNRWIAVQMRLPRQGGGEPLKLDYDYCSLTCWRDGLLAYVSRPSTQIEPQPPVEA